MRKQYVRPNLNNSLNSSSGTVSYSVYHVHNTGIIGIPNHTCKKQKFEKNSHNDMELHSKNNPKIYCIFYVDSHRQHNDNLYGHEASDGGRCVFHRDTRYPATNEGQFQRWCYQGCT